MTRFLRIMPFVALLLLAGCSGRGPAPITLTEADSAELVITLSPKQELVLRLSSNQSTGYSWQITKAPAMLKQVGEAVYTQDAAQPGMVGVGGTEEWRFKAVTRGTGILELSYQRPWDKGPAKKRLYNISVW